MPLFSFPKGNILFIHVPKTGGTAVELALKKQAPRGLFTRADSWKGFRLPCSAQHFHAELLEQLVPPTFRLASFMVVRHPVDRLISEYRYRRQLGDRALSIQEWWARWRLAYRANPYVLDNHLRPQVEFEVTGCRVFGFEEGLQPVAETIARQGGARAKDVQVARHKRSKGPSVQVSARFRHSVERFYRVDFERYGYE